MIKNILAVSLILVGFLPFSSAFAGPILRTGETISVDANQTLKGDFYGLGSKITISGGAENDAFLGGGTVTVNAPVSGDLAILGGSVQVHGDVGDDLRIVGGDITIGKIVKGDVVAFGGTLTILSTASIEGDVIFYGGELIVEGSVMGAVHGSADTVRVNAEVGGDITVTATSLFTLGSNAKVKSTITYESMNDVVRAQNADITGEVHKVTLEGAKAGAEAFKIFVFCGLILGFVTLSLFVLGKRQLQPVADVAIVRTGFAGLIGLGILFVVPFISIMLIVSVLGMFAGILLLITHLCLILGAIAIMPIVVGSAVQKITMKNTTLTFTTVLFGIVISTLISMLPLVGGLLLSVFFVVTLGSIGITLYERFRSV